MDPNLENDIMDESGLYRLQNIFNEILKGNLSIIDLDNQIFLSTISSFLLYLDDKSYTAEVTHNAHELVANEYVWDALANKILERIKQK